jgi:Galactose oxidase, central domain
MKFIGQRRFNMSDLDLPSRQPATLLFNGMTLVTGGYDGLSASPTTERYDPASGTWTVTGRLNTARVEHTATLLPNGVVLVAGGFDAAGFVVASAEVHHKTTRTWTFTGSLNNARAQHTGTLLPNKTVLAVGGYDPPNDTHECRTVQRAPIPTAKTVTPTPTRPTPGPCIGRCEPTPTARPTPHFRPTSPR